MIDKDRTYRTRSGLNVSELTPLPNDRIAGIINAKRPIITQWEIKTGKNVVMGCEEYDLVEVLVPDDLVKRVRRIGIGSELGATTRDRQTAQEAADRIEALEKKIKLLEQSQAAYALAGLGVDVMAAHNAGLEGLKAGCKEERLRAEKRIQTLEAALRELRDWNDNQGRRSVKIAAVIDAAITGENKE